MDARKKAQNSLAATGLNSLAPTSYLHPHVSASTVTTPPHKVNFTTLIYRNAMYSVANK